MKQIETYQLPENIDNEMIFIVNRDELDTRFDPQMALYRHKSLSSLYPKVKLGDLLVCKPQYGAAESGIERISEEEPRYIRITDIDDNGLISHDELGVTTETIEDKFILNDDDVLIARSGTVGKSYIHKDIPYRCIYAGYLIRFIVDKNRILPDYLFTFTQLKTYKEWITAIQRPGAQPNINAEEYQSLEIPLPNIVTQKIIVDTINAAYKTKSHKEIEAATIINSIDDYLLIKLGIKMPNTLDDYLEDRHFIAYFRDVIGKRLDPTYNGCIKFIHSLRCKYNFVKLADVIINDSCQYGANEEATDWNDGATRYIRITDVDEHGNLRPTNKKSAAVTEDKYLLKYNDILFARSGSVGKCYIHKDLTDRAIFAGYLIRFLMDTKKIDPDYLFYYCNSKLYWIWVNAIQRPAIQSNINSEEFKSMPIPLPPMDTQKEIVEHIRLMRDEAKRLQDEGTEILRKTKEDIEKTILG